MASWYPAIPKERHWLALEKEREEVYDMPELSVTIATPLHVHSPTRYEAETRIDRPSDPLVATEETIVEDKK